MHVAIDEAREEQTAANVVHLGLRSYVGLETGAVAYVGDVGPTDGYSLSPG